MGVRDRINAKLRARRGAKSTADQVSERDDSEVTTSLPSTTKQDHSTTALAPSLSSTSSTALPYRRRIPKFSALPSSTTSVRTRSTLLDTSTKLRHLLRTRRPRSTTSTNSAHIDDVPEPEPRILPSNPVATLSVHHYPSDTPLTDGYVSITVPPAWRAVRADDAIYLLSGQGVGFVKAVAAVDACEVLLEVGRLSIMSQVLVRSSPVWDGCEACVQYSLVGGFGIGIARFQDGFDAGAVVFAICAPNDKRQLVTDTIANIRRGARVVKVPKSQKELKNGIADGTDSKGKVSANMKADVKVDVEADTKAEAKAEAEAECDQGEEGKSEASCVVQ